MFDFDKYSSLEGLSITGASSPPLLGADAFDVCHCGYCEQDRIRVASAPHETRPRLGWFILGTALHDIYGVPSYTDYPIY